MNEAVLLRDVLRKTGAESPHDLALHWDEATRRELEPWYRATLTYDRHHRCIELNGLPVDGPATTFAR